MQEGEKEDGLHGVGRINRPMKAIRTSRLSDKYLGKSAPEGRTVPSAACISVFTYLPR